MKKTSEQKQFSCPVHETTPNADMYEHSTHIHANLNGKQEALRSLAKTQCCLLPLFSTCPERK